MLGIKEPGKLTKKRKILCLGLLYWWPQHDILPIAVESPNCATMTPWRRSYTHTLHDSHNTSQLSWYKWSWKLYLWGKVQLDLILVETIIIFSSKWVMASPLFRIHIVNLAGWRTGSRETVGLKMAVWKDKDNWVLDGALCREACRDPDNVNWLASLLVEHLIPDQ
jgi:hypothetical protein